MKRTDGRRKWRATPTTESGCNARWKADAIRSNTDWKLRTRKSRRCSGRGRGIARLFRRITAIGSRRTLRRESGTERAAVHEISFKKAIQAHLKIVFGTDMGGIPWTEPIAQEFKRMVGLGMAPMDAIQSATSRAAEMLDMKGEIGTIAPGAFAEVIAVSGDPLKDVGELENVTFVMHNGALFKYRMAY